MMLGHRRNQTACNMVVPLPPHPVNDSAIGRRCFFLASLIVLGSIPIAICVCLLLFASPSLSVFLSLSLRFSVCLSLSLCLFLSLCVRLALHLSLSPALSPPSSHLATEKTPPCQIWMPAGSRPFGGLCRDASFVMRMLMILIA